MTACAAFYLDYPDYRSSFAPYLRPLTFVEWLKIFNEWSSNHARNA
jgi:hypothetical protein